MKFVFHVKVALFLDRYELHEWVYQMHNALDEFKKREHGIYAVVANVPSSNPLDNFEDEAQQQQSQLQEQQQPQGIYAVVRKSNIKPTRQAPPLPPRSQDMNVLTDESPPDSAFESVSDKGRELLVSFGSGSDNDYLAQFRKHKRSLSDSLVITKAIDVGLAGSTPNGLNKGALKKTNSATNLTLEEVVKDKGFELPSNVMKRKRMNKRRKTIAHGGRRLSRSHSPPSEPPPPPPSGEKPPEVNQAIIDALYALDEELGQNIAVSPNNASDKVQIDHTTVFATFQPPPEGSHGLTSLTTGSHLVAPANSDHRKSEITRHVVFNGDGMQQNGGANDENHVDESHCVKPSKAAGKAKIDEIKDAPQEQASGVKKIPPPKKQKPPKPWPPLRTTSQERTIELSSNITPVSPVKINPPIIKPSITSTNAKQNKEGTEQPKKRSPPRVTFPDELEKVVKRKSLTTFNLDDLNKESFERKGNPLSPTKATSLSPSNPTPLSPSKPKNYSGAGAFSMHNDDNSTATSSTFITQSATDESMTKIFQEWPKNGLTNGSVSSSMSPVHSEPSQWRDSMADQHIYDYPWDRKMMAMNMAKPQANGFKPGDRNSLERRRTFSNGNQVNGAKGPIDRSYSVEQRIGLIKAPPRRGASIDDLFYNKGTSSIFTDNFKRGASTENLSSLDPSSPLYVYKKALQNHEQQQQEEEKERSYTLPLKGGARRRNQQGLPLQQSAQTSVRTQVNNGIVNGNPTRMVTSAQNDNRRFTSPPMQQQKQQPVQQQKQYQHTTEKHSLQSQPPKRANATNNYIKTNVNSSYPSYRPHVSNIGGRPISSIVQNGIHMDRRPHNTKLQPLIQENWQYYKSTRISYDKNSDTTILRSLV